MAQRRDSPAPGGSRRPGQRGLTSRGRVAGVRPEENGPAEGPLGGPVGGSADGTRDDTRVGPATQAGRASQPVRTPAPGRPRSPRGDGTRPRRSRFTIRAFVLAGIVVVLAVSYASSTRAYVQQRDSVKSLQEQISRTEKEIAELERERRRWRDPSFVKAQARSKLGYLMPGETGYQVLDENGEPLGAAADLSDPDAVGKEEKAPWWEDVWGSVELAGNPPPEEAVAPEKIDGVPKNEQQEKQ